MKNKGNKGDGSILLKLNASKIEPSPLFLGQVTLEFTLVFVIMVALLAGLLSLWKWSSDNIIKRQIDYNSTRAAAGQISAAEEPPATYEAQQMTEKDVYLFK